MTSASNVYSSVFPEIDNETALALTRHNQRWGESHTNWLRHAIPPWWARNLIITPEIRESYEKWLPMDEFRRSFTQVSRAYLPDESWLPLPLRSGAYLSLPDFWAAMPPSFAGKVCFLESELLPLFCAMADPPRFGTTAGRYPEELEYLKGNVRSGMSVLDVGCGVGVNTLEMSSAVKGAFFTGITPEPLEVWMAIHRRIPHDVQRQAIMAQFDGTADFKCGTAEEFSGEYDFIVCNGLIGGRFLWRDSQYKAFLLCCRTSLRPSGRVLIADRFHDGQQQNLERFKRLAVASGFSCDESHSGFMVIRRLEG